MSKIVKMESVNLFGEKEKTASQDVFEPKLKNGHKFDEVASALQKSIRRGDEWQAMYWASILYKSGYSLYLKRRLAVIVHEDIGIANPIALILANQLKLEATVKMRDKKYEGQEFSGDGILPIVNLILIACRGKKTRVADELINLMFDKIDKYDFRIEVPEYAIDPHTDKGREIYGYWESGTREESHKRIKKWFDEWAKLENEASEEEVPNPYKEKLKKLWGYYNPKLSPIKKDRK